MINRLYCLIRSKIAYFLFPVLFVAVWFFSNQVHGASGVVIPSDTGLPNTTFQVILTNFLKWLLYVFGILAIISFVVTGIMYLLGGSMTGEKKDVSGAKRQLQWSIIGVIVALSAYVILKAINAWFGGSSEF